jgi:hypothetical protein
MKSVRIHEFGPPNVIVIDDLPKPTTGDRRGLGARGSNRGGALGYADSRGQEQGSPCCRSPSVRICPAKWNSLGQESQSSKLASKCME